MSGFPILDLVVGLVFIFFILSIITSSIVEIIISRSKMRNKFLNKWLVTIFDKEMKQPDGKTVSLGQAIADHCLTTALSGNGKATSFMDAKNFVSALIEKVSYDPNGTASAVIANLDELLQKISNAKATDGTSLLSTELQRTILIFGVEAKLAASVTQPAGSTMPVKSALDIFREKLEHWYDSSMDRVTGKMKSKYIRPVTFWVGAAVVIALNVNTVQISKYLYDHKEEAKQFADKAQNAVANFKVDTAGSHDVSIALKNVKTEIELLRTTTPKGMPLGWSDDLETYWCNHPILSILGWLATVAAIMLGAPFWFDLLNKIANIRGSGAKPASATDKDKDVKTT